MMRMTAVMYAVVIAALLSGCEEQPEKPPAKETTPEVTSEQPAARASGLEITLGDHATPALEALVAECHVPSPEELAIISLLSREGAPVEDAAPVLGVALPEDDFARGKAKKELEEKLAAHKKELGAKVLCLRLEVGVERYDFDRERFALKEDNAFAVVTDLTENATTQRERLSLERGVELGDSPWPAMLVAVLPGKHISASKKDAERVNDALHPATVNEEEDTSEPVEETSQKERRNDPFTALTRLATKGEKEALLAIIAARGDNPLLGSKKQERGAPAEEGARGATKAYLKKLDETFAIGQDARRADVYVFFSLAQTISDVKKVDGFDGASLLMTAIDPSHVVFTDADGVAFAATSPAPKVTAATYADLSNSGLRGALEESCRGRIKRRRKTVMKGGELVDQVSYTCSRCPSGSSDPDERNARITRVLQGSFLMPGSADTLVLYAGCEPMVNLGGGALLTTRDARGQRAMARWLPGLTDTCQVLDVRGGRDRIICEDTQMGGGAVDGEVVAYALTPSGELAPASLSPIFDTRDTCASDTHAFAVPREVTVSGEDASVTIAYRAGVATYSGDCNLESEDIEELEVTYVLDARSGEFEVSGASKAALKKIQELEERGN